MPRVSNDDDVPDAVRVLVDEDERILYHAVPIRREGGLGVWLIMALGVLFVPASVGALREIFQKTTGREWSWSSGIGLVFTVGFALVFFLFSLLMLVWPVLSERARRRTHVLITDARVIEVRFKDAARTKTQRLRSFTVESCDALSVTRRRGRSATLVLKERVTERKSTGQPTYNWDAIHGLEDADLARTVVEEAIAARVA